MPWVMTPQSTQNTHFGWFSRGVGAQHRPTTWCPHTWRLEMAASCCQSLDGDLVTRRAQPARGCVPLFAYFLIRDGCVLYHHRASPTTTTTATTPRPCPYMMCWVRVPPRGSTTEHVQGQGASSKLVKTPVQGGGTLTASPHHPNSCLGSAAAYRHADFHPSKRPPNGARSRSILGPRQHKTYQNQKVGFERGGAC